MVGALRELAALLEGEEWISQPTLVSARVPLIKAFAPLPPHLAPLPRSGRLALDISLDDGGHAGASSTAFTKDVLLPSLPALRPTTARAQGAEASTRPRRVHDSSLRPLVLVLKSLLASRGLSDGYTGGLTGYAIVLMAAAVLQHHEASLGRERSLGVGAALACFLETYSRDPRHAHAPHRHAVHAVTLDAGARLQPTVVCRSDPLLGGAPLLVQDPLDVENNVGASAFNFPSVQRLLREALERLDTASCCAAGEADARADGGTSGADAIALAEALSLDRHEPQEGAMSDCPRG